MFNQEKEWGINEYREKLESQLLEAELNATSDYNDGWTQEAARKEVVILKEKLKRVGKQLKLDL